MDLDTEEQETYILVVAEMMDFDLGHISLGSPLGRALSKRKVGEDLELRLPRGLRKLRILELQTENGKENRGQV
jgi:transcription elongation factor GreA